MTTKRKPTRKKPARKTAAKRPVRKTAARAKPRKKPRKRSNSGPALLKPLLGLSIVVLVVLTAVLLVDLLLEPASPDRPVPARTTKPAVQPDPQPKATAVAPKYEVFPPTEPAPEETSPPLPEAIPADKKPPVPGRPRIAIIIDDLGYDKQMAAKFLSLDAALTFAVLPHSPHQKTIADLAYAKGRETMLHLPMEPKEYPSTNPGPGTLLSTMSPDELIRQLEDNLAAVPHIKGVNNHMGSKLTTASDQIHQVFSILKKRGLFFVDSRTTGATVCRPAAKLLQVPFAQRDVFIDHFQKSDFIRKQLKDLVRIAHRNGQAVGIAHPHGITYRILKELLPEIQNEVKVVPASEIVALVG
jgi:polysaccharide deacetylase 2 family uncharacterized protein YibQ